MLLSSDRVIDEPVAHSHVKSWVVIAYNSYSTKKGIMGGWRVKFAPPPKIALFCIALIYVHKCSYHKALAIRKFPSHKGQPSETDNQGNLLQEILTLTE